MKDYYSILEVNENASREVIEKAYKVLVKRYHPDLQNNNSVAEKKIKEVNEAYNVLSDNFLREQYDKELKATRQSREENTSYKEEDYSRLYKEKERLKYTLAHEREEKDRIATNSRRIIRNSDANETSTTGIIGLIRSMFQSFPRMINDLKNVRRIDFLALFLTVVIVILIGLILYCIPFTHDWMNENFVDTALVNWIKGLFN